MSQQAVSKLSISIREVFSNSVPLNVINNYHQGAVKRISTEFGPFPMLLFKGSSETGIFRHLSNHVFRVRNFANTKSMRVIF